jgi:hypothetical protein
MALSRLWQHQGKQHEAQDVETFLWSDLVLPHVATFLQSITGSMQGKAP